MDRIITDFFNQCETGRVDVGQLYYNLYFSINGTNSIFNIKVNDKEKFYNYIKEFLNLFNLETEFEIYRKLVYLFSNLTFSDYENIEEYLKKNISFVKNKIFSDDEIIFLENRILMKVVPCYLETPYWFKIIISDGSNQYELPLISYGIYDGVCYIYAIQDKNKDKTSDYSKKIKRILYKINNGIKETEEYEEFKKGESDYYPENISDVSPSAILALSIFMNQLYEKGITKVKVIPFLPMRYHAKQVAYRKKVDYLAEIDKLGDKAKKDLMQHYEEEQLRIQNNLTQKFIRSFLRVSYHFPNIQVISLPFESDENLSILITSFEKDIFDSLCLDKLKK